METRPSHQEARLSLLFVLPAQAVEGEAIHSVSPSPGATNGTPAADRPVKCRTLLDEVINCTAVSGEAVELETVVDETVNSETVSDDESANSDTTKHSGDSEIVKISDTKPSTVFTNRSDGKRQFIGQNSNRLGNVGSGGNTLNQAAIRPGSNPQAAVTMVQSFVEDMISRPNGDRPGYIMINSPNPAIIQQLVATLTQRYGSASVIQDNGAIQNLTRGAAGDSLIHNLNTSSSAASSDMPMFPFESRWKGATRTEPSTASVDPEVDYIRQQLASIAHVSVSTGQLVNDTLVYPAPTPTTAITLNLTADATVAPSAPATTQAAEDHHPTYVHDNPDDQHQDIQNTEAMESTSSNSTEELQSTNQQVSSGDSNLGPEGHFVFNEVVGQRVEDEGREEDYHSETSITYSAVGNDLTLPEYLQESENLTMNFAEYKYAPPLIDENEIIKLSNLMDTNPPNVTTRPINNTVSKSHLVINESTSNISAANDQILTTESPKINSVFDEDPVSVSEETSKNAINVTSVLNNEVSTTGYEDYYEEIDGELVLSPTKFMRKGSPMVTADYVGDEDYYQLEGIGLTSPQHDSTQLEWNQSVGAQHDGHQTGGSPPAAPQPHLVDHLTGWASGEFASHGVAESEYAVVSPFPHNSNLIANTAAGEVLEDINNDSVASLHTSSVLFNDRSPSNIPDTPLSAANSQPYSTSYSNLNQGTEIVGSNDLKSGGSYSNGYENTQKNFTRFTLNQELDNYIKSGIHPLYPNYGNAFHNLRPSNVDLEGYMNGGMIPASSQVLEELRNMDEDSSRLALLEELDRIPVVYDNVDLVTRIPILRALPSDVLDHLAGMEEEDLATLGLLDQMKTMAGSFSRFGDTADHPVSEGFPGKDSSVRVSLQSTDQNTKSVGVSKELTSSQIERAQYVAESELEVPVRSSFSSGNYRQSDVNIEDQLIPQPVPPNFFPRRPTEPPYPGSGQHGGHHGTGHHHGSGHQPQLTPEQQGIISRLPSGMQEVVSSIVLAVQAPSSLTTSTTIRPQQYPYPYPYPYPLYPYFPPPSYPYQFSPRPADLSSSNDFSVQDAHGGHVVHSGHGSDGAHSIHDHSTHGAHTPHGDHSAHGHGAHTPHGGHTAHGSHGAHTPHGDQNVHNHGTHASHGGNEVTHDNHSSHSTHGDHGSQNSHGTQSTGPIATHHDHSSHGHGHQGSQGSDGAKDDLRGGAAGDDDAITTPSRPVTSNALRGTPRPAVLTPSIHASIPGTAPALLPLPGVPVAGNLPSVAPTFNPDAIGASRLGEFDATGLDDISETGIRENNNKQGSISRVGPSQPDRNQGLLQLRQDPAQMGHGRPSGSGFVNYRPPQQTNMHMGTPVVNVVLPQAATSVPVSVEEEIGPLIDLNEVEDDTPVTNAPQTMNREQVNSLLQSLFSSPTLLLLGIVFAASAAYMAIAMEEQAAQQNFQQAQLAAAFGGQPFPPGRRRRRNIATTRLWYPSLPQLVDR